MSDPTTNVNKVTLLGQLADDPESPVTTSGVRIANLGLVTCTYAGRDEAGVLRRHTELHRLVMFGRRADFAMERLRAGSLVYAEGRAQSRLWLPEGNQTGSITEVIVNSLKVLDPR